MPIAEAQSIQYVGSSISYIGDRGHLLSADSALAFSSLCAKLDSAPKAEKVLNLGVTHKHHYFSFHVNNESSEDKLMLNVAFPSIDLIELVEITDCKKPILKAQTGQEFAYYTRGNSYRDFIFGLDIKPGSSKHYVLHVKSDEQILLPIKLQPVSETITETISQDIFFGMYSGVILVMFLYNLFVYFSTRDRSYLFYVIYILSIGMAQAVLQGYAFRFLWPAMPYLAKIDTYVFGAFSGITALVFARDFLKIRRFSLAMDNFLLVLIGIDVLAIVLSISGVFSLAYNIINLVAGLGSISLLIMASYLGFVEKNREAKFFLLAWSVLLVSVIIYVLKDITVVPFNDFTDSVLMIGSGIESVLLSLALADRINILKLENTAAQKRELQAVKQNEKLVKEQNVLLEQKVNERTNELRNTNQQLEKAMQELKNAQVQLVNAEKMASLGQLTAGIAHEINNPINFVAASIIPLRQDLNDLEQLISFYDSKLNEWLDESKQKTISDYKASNDFEFTLQELKSLIDGVEVGANRTAEIVLGLKTFSRLDESESNEANVHDLLDSTLIVLRNLTKDKVHIQKHFVSNMPSIKCFPGKLNQVFSNIIVNAIQAMVNTEYPKIVITTELEDEVLLIRIKDNGPGISDEIKSKIFDPFFTTKEVGKGTGLGLSIVYSIINEHGGLLAVASEVGKGTEFIITLPLSME
ncbi:MAG: ATP-binding protein [Salibacteraceae bacterium]|nr:ATP-binding protein [Salibacteraceae bacterium]